MKKLNLTDILLHTLCIMIAVIMIVPFYNVVIRSVASPAAIAKQTFYIIPTSFDLSAYKVLVDGGKIFKAFGVSLVVTIGGTLISMFVSTLGAYALAKETLPGRRILLVGIVFTMFFSGGLIPSYLNIKSLGLMNNILVMMLPMAVNTFYLIIMINYFKSVPASLEESARIDGAGFLRTLISVIIPISLPTMAAITLFYAVDRWNEWWSALLYISDTSKYPMQLYLREMLVDATKMASDGNSASMMSSVMKTTTPDGLKMATVLINIVPIMLLYPFLQKHFAAGVMVGSIKE